MSRIGKIKDLGRMIDDVITSKIKLLVDECEKYTESQDIELIVENESNTDIAVYNNFQNGKLTLKIIDASIKRKSFDTDMGYPEVMLAESSKRIQMLLHCDDDITVSDTFSNVPYDKKQYVIESLGKDSELNLITYEYKKRRDEYDESIRKYRKVADEKIQELMLKIAKGEGIPDELQLDTRQTGK